MAKSPLTTHVLDTSNGLPAQNLPITLCKLSNGNGWIEKSTGSTNSDGRCPGLISQENFQPGTYKLTFNTDAYFKSRQIKGFYPYVEIAFNIEDEHQHYHVPLLLSPYGYSTYRGS